MCVLIGPVDILCVKMLSLQCAWYVLVYVNVYACVRASQKLMRVSYSGHAHVCVCVCVCVLASENSNHVCVILDADEFMYHCTQQFRAASVYVDVACQQHV